MRGAVRGLIPDLPSAAWRVLRADLVSALGTGLVLPFLIVYLRDVRGFHVVTASLAVSTMAVAGLLSGIWAGVLVDRIGPRTTLMASLVTCSAGSVLIAFVTEPWHAFVAASVLGAGIGAIWPATNSLFVSIVPPEHSQDIFAMHYATLNLGIGLGGIIGGLLASTDHPGTFQILYIADALSWLVLGAVLLRMKDVGGRIEIDDDEDQPAVGYRALFKDTVYLRLLAVMALFVTLGYAQLQSGFPAFATEDGGISTRALGFAFAANTFTIVVAQLIVLKRIGNKRRTRALLVVCFLWAISWAIVLFTPQVDVDFLRAAGFALAMAVFGLGECLISPTIPAMINNLAPANLRGRYNAGYSFTFAFGEIIGPAVAGLMLGAGRGQGLFVLLIISCGIAALLIMSLEKRIPPGANRSNPAEVPGELQPGPVTQA